MAVTQTNPMGHVQKDNKSVQQTIPFAFTTTATSGTITTILKRVRSATFTIFPATAIAGAETLYIVGASTDANGFMVVPSNGQLMVGRTGASVTSGLKCSVRLEGY